ncbi:MAG: hypothetical protein GOU97_00265 [Nanoarchaeota archaeon]|nr:hypothetical protein [Nanoarchaeota archaeon]
MVGEEITGPLSQVGDWLIGITVQAVPLIISSALIIFIGWVVASIIERIVSKTLRGVKLDKWLKERNITKALFNVSMESLVASVIKWYVFLLFLQEAAFQINFLAISTFFGSILVLIPQWSIGVITIAVALIIGNWFKDRINESGAVFSGWIGNVIYGFVAYVGVVLALPKFGFTNVEILTDAFKLVVGGLSLGLALAIGIGFGWALKEGPAKDFFKRFEKKEE